MARFDELTKLDTAIQHEAWADCFGEIFVYFPTKSAIGMPCCTVDILNFRTVLERNRVAIVPSYAGIPVLLTYQMYFPAPFNVTTFTVFQSK